MQLQTTTTVKLTYAFKAIFTACGYLINVKNNNNQLNADAIGPNNPCYH
jgi:hypothetical protein